MEVPKPQTIAGKSQTYSKPLMLQTILQELKSARGVQQGVFCTTSGIIFHSMYYLMDARVQAHLCI
jgi:hypothetical protein